jgi:hypothetical protein
MGDETRCPRCGGEEIDGSWIDGKPVALLCVTCGTKRPMPPRSSTTGTPARCPVCNGTGQQSRPPNVAGDVQTWVDDGVRTYPCPACNATGIVRPVAPPPRDASEPAVCECGAPKVEHRHVAGVWLLGGCNAYRPRRAALPEEAPTPAVCPCTLTTPCCVQCSCADGYQSGGCRRCATYGSAEQRLAAAQSIALALSVGRSLLAALETVPGSSDLLIRSSRSGYMVAIWAEGENDATRALAAGLSAAKVNG